MALLVDVDVVQEEQERQFHRQHVSLDAHDLDLLPEIVIKAPEAFRASKRARMLSGLPNDSRAGQGALRSCVLTCKNHNLPAVYTGDIDHFRSPDRVSATRADIFSAVGWLGWYGDHSSAAVSTSTGDRDSVEVVPGNQDISQSGFQNEVQQVITGMGDSPTIFGVVFYNQTMGFGNGFEALVMVQIASAGIFDSVDTAVIVGHFMQKRRCY